MARCDGHFRRGRASSKTQLHAIFADQHRPFIRVLHVPPLHSRKPTATRFLLDATGNYRELTKSHVQAAPGPARSEHDTSSLHPVTASRSRDPAPWCLCAEDPLYLRNALPASCSN